MRLGVVVALVLVLALPAAAADVQHGKRVYGKECVSCHGPNGEGSGAGPSLRGVGARAADFYLSTGYMPLKHPGLQPRRSHLLLGPGEIADLTAYVASLGTGPGVPHPHPERGNLSEGMHAFTERCAGCHQVVARGGYVTDALPPGLGEATPTQIAEAVRIGPYVMPAFSERQISNDELDSIVKYVLYARQPDDPGGWSLGDIGPIPEGLVTWFLAMSVLIATCIVLGRRLRG